MKKSKRILSVILIAAMALSLMPTFASADGTTSYTYMFNPKELQNGTDLKGYTYNDTAVYDTDGTSLLYHPWSYIEGKYVGSLYPQSYCSSSFYGMQVTANTSGNMWWAAFKIQVPEIGSYTAKLEYMQHSNSGSVNVYILPANTAYSTVTDFSAEFADYKLNKNGALSLCGVGTTDRNANTEDKLTGEITTTAANEDCILLFETVGFSTADTTKTKNACYIKSLTLTKTADEEGGEVTPPEEEEKKDPITLTFDTKTITSVAGVLSTLSAAEGGNFEFVQNKSSSATTTKNSKVSSYGLLLSTFRADGVNKNYLSRITDSDYMAIETNDKFPGRLTISAKNIPAGTYKLSAGVHNFTRGCGVYYYVNDEYVGFDNAYSATGSFDDKDVTTEETIGYITILDSDNDSSTANPVEISLCSAAVDYESSANLYVLRNITFTPVEEIPSYGELDCTVDGEAAKTSYSVANGDVLSVSAMLSAKHLNGYNLDGTKDSENYIKITSSNPEVISVTDTEAALDSAKIYASGYKPVYTLTALRSNASAIITVEAIVDGKSIASKEFTVLVAKSDADTYEPSASFAWGTTLPSMLVAGNVSVAEKDGVPVNVGSITASKGTTYTLSAKNEIVDGDTTYKFIGWKRGVTSNGAAAFIGYETEDEYTVWSNTYITAVYDKISDSDEKRVEFYNQDSYYLGYMTESQFEANGIPTKTPKLLGHTFSKWQYVDANGETKEFTADTKLTENVTRVVALQIPTKVTITYKNENNEVTEEKTYDYDGVVDALADSGISDVTYWTILAGDNEKTVRTSNGYSFYAWANTTLKGYTGEVTEKLPKAVLHNTPHDDSYMIEYDIYSKAYTIVETGILLGDSESISLLSCEKKYTSAKGGRAHGQFAAPHENYDYVRGYIIYKTNETGAISVVYTDAITTGK